MLNEAHLFQRAFRINKHRLSQIRMTQNFAIIFILVFYLKKIYALSNLSIISISDINRLIKILGSLVEITSKMKKVIK